MKKINQIHFGLTLFLSVLIFCNIFSLFIKRNSTETVDSFNYKARLNLSVLESGSKKSIADAVVFIPELSSSFKTNKAGKLCVLNIENLPNSFLTILIFHKDFKDTIIFYLPVKSGENVDYTCFLLDKDYDDRPYIVYTESPKDEDILSLIEKYKKSLTA